MATIYGESFGDLTGARMREASYFDALAQQDLANRERAAAAAVQAQALGRQALSEEAGRRQAQQRYFDVLAAQDRERLLQEQERSMQAKDRDFSRQLRLREASRLEGALDLEKRKFAADERLVAADTKIKEAADASEASGLVRAFSEASAEERRLLDRFDELNKRVQARAQQALSQGFTVTPKREVRPADPAAALAAAGDPASARFAQALSSELANITDEQKSLSDQIAGLRKLRDEARRRAARFRGTFTESGLETPAATFPFVRSAPTTVAAPPTPSLRPQPSPAPSTVVQTFRREGGVLVPVQ